MNDRAVGLALRAIRHRLGRRQADVAQLASVSQQLVSKIEAGRLASVSIGTLRRVLRAVGADVVVVVRWRGGELDRLLDEGHADIASSVCAMLRRRGWVVLTEVTFSVYGERGSVDVLAWHAASRTLLVIEVKTEIASAEETLRRHDAKVRLAPALGRERFGVDPASVAALLVVADRSTNRRRVGRLAELLHPAYPRRGDAVRAWLRHPEGPMRGLLFVAGTRRGAVRPGRVVRHRAPGRSPGTPGGGAGATSLPESAPSGPSHHAQAYPTTNASVGASNTTPART